MCQSSLILILIQSGVGKQHRIWQLYCRREGALMSSLVELTFARETGTNMTSFYWQYGELYILVRVQIYVYCMFCIVHTAHPLTLPYNSSQYCRQELCCRFHYGFQLSWTKVGSITVQQWRQWGHQSWWEISPDRQPGGRAELDPAG